MNPASNSASGGRAAPRGAQQGDSKTKQGPANATPSPDMQSEDAGTAASGNGGRVNPAEAAMKQEHKSDRERGR